MNFVHCISMTMVIEYQKHPTTNKAETEFQLCLLAIFILLNQN